MAVPTVVSTGSGTDNDATIGVTVPAAGATELTIVHITGNGTAVITPPAGWNRVPGLGGHSGVAGGASRQWAYYKWNTSSGTENFSSDTIRNFTWATIVLASVNTAQPFGSKRRGNTTASSTGLASCQIPATPVTDCMMMSLVVCGAAASGYTTGTWVEDVEVSNGSGKTGYIVHNVTDYLAVDADGVAAGPTWDWPGTTDGHVSTFTLCPSSNTTLNIGLPLDAGLASTTTATTNTTPQTGNALYKIGDFVVPGALYVSTIGSNDETWTVSSCVMSDTVGAALTNTIAIADHSTTTLSASTYHILFDESTAYAEHIGATAQYVKYTLSGAVTFMVGVFMMLGAESTSPISLSTRVEFATSTAPDPASFATSTDDVIVQIAQLQGNVTVTNSTGYTQLFSTSAGGLNRTAIAWKRATGASDDPGALTYSLTNPSYITHIVVASSSVSLPSNTVVPALSGNVYVGETLTTTSGTWSGGGSITYAYSWQISPDGATGWIQHPITGTATTQAIPASAYGKYLRSKVLASNSAGTGDPAYSTATAVVKRPMQFQLSASG